MARTIRASDQAEALDPEQIFDKHLRIIEPLRKTVDDTRDAHRTANSVYRAALKEAKKDAVDIDALVEAFAISKEEPEDVTRRFSNLNRYLVWMKIPVGTQLGLFAEGLTVATAVDNVKLKEQASNGNGRGTVEEFEVPMRHGPAAMAAAFDAGRKAGLAGKNLNTCPYKNPANEKLKTEWEKGWSDGQAKIAEGLRPPQPAKRRGRGSKRETRPTGLQ